MRQIFATVPLCLALAACGSGDSVSVKDAKPEAVAQKVAASAIRPQAGKWESRLSIEKMEFPGMPAQMAAQMQKSMGLDKVLTTCLTPQQTERPDASFFQQGAQGCTYDRFAMADGRIDGKMTCLREGARQEVTMAGSYSEQAYDLTTTSSAKLEGQMPINMTMKVSARRVGDCDAKGG